MDARKKKKAGESQRKSEKEKEITRRMRAGENRSDVGSELESKDPTKVGDDMIFSEEEESQDLSTPRWCPNWYASFSLLCVLFPLAFLLFNFESLIL